jgi:hypothetical protein
MMRTMLKAAGCDKAHRAGMLDLIGIAMNFLVEVRRNRKHQGPNKSGERQARDETAHASQRTRSLAHAAGELLALPKIAQGIFAPNRTSPSDGGQDRYGGQALESENFRELTRAPLQLNERGYALKSRRRRCHRSRDVVRTGAHRLRCRCRRATHKLCRTNSRHRNAP